jgi:hypothetical protein
MKFLCNKLKITKQKIVKFIEDFEQENKDKIRKADEEESEQTFSKYEDEIIQVI